ncbi:MAG: response regulator [Chitinophagaceae bacterium]|nr:response regulator [Chitinophagaceae bacterium]
MLIDDDPDELEVFNHVLDLLQVPCACIQALNTDLAIQLLQNISPDIIFLDHKIPIKYGLVCLAEIRQLPNYQETPVIFCSNALSSDLEQKALKAGATVCIKKYDQLSQLKDLLSKILLDSYLIRK